MVRMNARRTIGPKRIERSREIYKAIAADAAACGMTPKQFAERFMDQAIRGGFICTVETGKNR
jgi:hypothetical protein